MRIVVISSSLSANSRSEKLALFSVDFLAAQGVEVEMISLKEKRLDSFDDSTIYDSSTYQELHAMTVSADGLIFASPVYNWGLCSEMKKYVECVGSTPPDQSRRGAFFDKVITFVSSAGLPHSYMAYGSMALSMMMDFKCLINPYTAYIHNRHWEDDTLVEEARIRLEKSLSVMIELTALMQKRSYQSGWEI